MIHLLYDENDRILGAYSSPEIAESAGRDREKRLYRQKRLRQSTYSRVGPAIEVNAPVPPDLL